MIKLVGILLLISVSIPATAQTSVKNDSSCNFLKNVRFKNGLDTVVVKTSYLDVAEMIPLDKKFEPFDKEKKIKSKSFNYQIGIRPEGCEKIYSAPCSYKGDLNRFKPGATFLVTCIVFERQDLASQGTPFFVVIKIKAEKPK